MVCVIFLCFSWLEDLFLFLILSYQFLTRACVACDVFGCVFRLCFVKQGIQPRENWTEVKREGREDRQLFSLLFSLTPFLLLFHLTSHFTKQERKTHKKTACYAGYIYSIPALSHFIRKQSIEVSVFEFDDVQYEALWMFSSYLYTNYKFKLATFNLLLYWFSWYNAEVAFCNQTLLKEKLTFKYKLALCILPSLHLPCAHF